MSRRLTFSQLLLRLLPVRLRLLACAAMGVLALCLVGSASATLPVGYGAGPGYCTSYPGGVTSSFSFENVYACKGTTTGTTTFDIPGVGVYAWQCVELSARFLWAIYGIWAGPGTGVQNGADLVSVIGKEYNLPIATSAPDSLPAAGDVMSFQSGGDGHTAVVISSPDSQGKFTVMSENDPLNSAGEQTLQIDLTGGHNGKVYDGDLGGWVPANWLALAVGAGGSTHASDDFNGDGKSDVAFLTGVNGGTTGSGHLEVHGAYGPGFSSRGDFATSFGYLNTASALPFFADVNGDGKADMCFLTGVNGGTTGSGDLEVHCAYGPGFSSRGDFATSFGYLDSDANPVLDGVDPILKIAESGSGSGSVTSAPTGVDCGSACLHSFPMGTRVTLSAAAEAGSTFAGWSGGGCSGTGTCTVSVDSAITVTATFHGATTPTYTLTVSRAGSGSGSVTSSPAGIACGTTCSYGYAGGTAVTLSAVAAPDSTFAGWSGGCSGTGACTVVTTGDASVSAMFDLNATAKPKPCVVPKVKGKTLKAAGHAIKTHNCKVGKIKRVLSRRIKKGRIISQKPKPGRRLKHFARVSLVVSKGRP